MQKQTLITFFMFCLGCTHINTGHAKPQEVNHDDAKKCRLLASVEGSSGYGKNVRWQPIAKSNAERKAEALGATHIEFLAERDSGSSNGYVKANAYTCP
jgi:hypothetical protein